MHGASALATTLPNKQPHQSRGSGEMLVSHSRVCGVSHGGCFRLRGVGWGVRACRASETAAPSRPVPLQPTPHRHSRSQGQTMTQGWGAGAKNREPTVPSATGLAKEFGQSEHRMSFSRDPASGLSPSFCSSVSQSQCAEVGGAELRVRPAWCCHLCVLTEGPSRPLTLCSPQLQCPPCAPGLSVCLRSACFVRDDDRHTSQGLVLTLCGWVEGPRVQCRPWATHI